MKKVVVLCLLVLFFTFPLKAQSGAVGSFKVGDKTFMLNDKPFVVKAAEIHYPRIPKPYWEHRIQMCKALGMNAICLYVFWNIHEQQEGKFDFTGSNDIADFVELHITEKSNKQTTTETLKWVQMV